MFSHRCSKLELFAEMNGGKFILINTAKDLVKEPGTGFFGRFLIALLENDLAKSKHPGCGHRNEGKRLEGCIEGYWTVANWTKKHRADRLANQRIAGVDGSSREKHSYR